MPMLEGEERDERKKNLLNHFKMFSFCISHFDYSCLLEAFTCSASHMRNQRVQSLWTQNPGAAWTVREDRAHGEICVVHIVCRPRPLKYTWAFWGHHTNTR